MKMKTSITEIDINQVGTVSDIIRQAFKKQAEILDISEKEYPNYVAFEKSNSIFNALDKGENVYLLICDEIPAGTIRFNQNISCKSKGYINRLAVLPEYRGNDFGKILMDFAEGELRKAGVKKIEISIVKDFVKLENYYISLGYSFVKDCKYDSLPFEVRFLEKALD